MYTPRDTGQRKGGAQPGRQGLEGCWDSSFSLEHLGMCAGKGKSSDLPVFPWFHRDSSGEGVALATRSRKDSSVRTTSNVVLPACFAHHMVPK